MALAQHRACPGLSTASGARSHGNSAVTAASSGAWPHWALLFWAPRGLVSHLEAEASRRVSLWGRCRARGAAPAATQVTGVQVVSLARSGLTAARRGPERMQAGREAAGLRGPLDAGWRRGAGSAVGRCEHCGREERDGPSTAAAGRPGHRGGAEQGSALTGGRGHHTHRDGRSRKPPCSQQGDGLCG